jgi:hypothetical protein
MMEIVMVVIPRDEWEKLCYKQDDILRHLKELQEIKRPAGIPVKHITAKEFMAAVRIGRTKFDQLVNTNKIKVIKKKRKIYLIASEVERYFTDQSIR